APVTSDPSVLRRTTIWSATASPTAKPCSLAGPSRILESDADRTAFNMAACDGSSRISTPYAAWTAAASIEAPADSDTCTAEGSHCGAPEFRASCSATWTIAAALCWRCPLRPAAAAACNVITFQSVTTSARTSAEKPISASNATPSLLRVIFRLPLFESPARPCGLIERRLRWRNDGAGEGSNQCTAPQLRINYG